MEKRARSEAIEAALSDFRLTGKTRTETIEFRGELRSFEVVRINASVPLLNHDNSRLRAQLATHASRELVYSDPFSVDAQNILTELLSQTEKFQELQRELKAFGQQHPGIITRDGMLVNGNTRLAATRLNGEEGFDVAVLPTDATSDDFFDIEMSLQLRKLVHQDYTFTNRLLLVDSSLKRSKNEASVIKSMNWQRGGQVRLSQHRRLLALVEEIREISGWKLDYKFFDSKEEMLKNLDTAYQAALAESPRDAEMLKWSRITAMGLSLNKDEVRAIDYDFVETALKPRTDGTKAGEFLSAFKTQKPTSTLDELLGDLDTEKVSYDMRKVAQTVLTEVAADHQPEMNQGLEKFDYLYKAMRTSARDLIEAEVKDKMRSEPIDYLKDVTLKIEELTNNLPDLFKDTEFDKGKFGFQAKKTQKSLQALQAELERQLGS